ncbi:hypothetical protein SAMN04488005_1880 [Yoonia tamlensis]|uniref:Uncharacterized protein n=1 Tax=Yoonia tamlensis TaxID=390270 RepID=A0A1I6GM33_9RHOB|nr:hypothetical protein SAMN04488005_1880 [Yoonia tamlensis]
MHRHVSGDALCSEDGVNLCVDTNQKSVFHNLLTCNSRQHDSVDHMDHTI